MKFKTTQKELRSYAGRKLAISYGYAQYLLAHRSPVAYTSGVYGWNCDVYYIDDVQITTGYRGCIGKHIGNDLMRVYENKAKAILDADFGVSAPFSFEEHFNKQTEQLHTLWLELFDKVFGKE